LKIDRLLGITMYLLNRDIVSAKELAEKFEVSVRTIVRDIESLSIAGIPISSSTGAFGGYEILDTFKLNKQMTTVDDYLFIITALKGLCSAYDNKKINATLEKMLATGYYKDYEQRIFIDFSVVNEGNNIPEYVREIEEMIRTKIIIKFNYTNSAGIKNHRIVEPLALNYRWHAWYLLAFCLYKNDYRFFKLNRLTDLIVTDESTTHEHGNISDLLEQQWNNDTRRCFDVKLLCKKDAKTAILEYIRGEIVEELKNGDFIISTNYIENERMWFSLLLGFGNMVKVLEPPEIINMLKEKSLEIQNLY